VKSPRACGETVGRYHPALGAIALEEHAVEVEPRLIGRHRGRDLRRYQLVGHLHYFQSEAAQLGLSFTEDAELFFEHFRLLAVFGRADP
jgi:hypothetical protein